jgi:hypothetical protein
VLILLPPSEGKTAPVRGAALRPESLSFPALREPRGAMLDALVSLCTTDGAAAADALGLGPTQSGEVDRNARLRTAPTARADRVYSGVLYEALDLGSLDQPPAAGPPVGWRSPPGCSGCCGSPTRSRPTGSPATSPFRASARSPASGPGTWTRW